MTENSQVEGDSANPAMENNMVGMLGWAKGPHGEAKPSPKWPIQGVGQGATWRG